MVQWSLFLNLDFCEGSNQSGIMHEEALPNFRLFCVEHREELLVVQMHQIFSCFWNKSCSQIMHVCFTIDFTDVSGRKNQILQELTRSRNRIAFWT